jgi:NADH-quinone oxidoreductase subunit H
MDLRFGIQLAIIGVTFFMLISASALLVLAERKIMGFMQQRYGPYLVGPHGLLQPLADILKLLMKEELRPKGADKWLFTLAPIVSITAAFAAFATVPWGAETTFFGLLDQPVKLGVADVNVGILVVFAITSMGVYGIVLAGWSSNSKYSLMGGLRASAQMISYELAYATSLAAVILLAATVGMRENALSLREVVDAQSGFWFGFIPKWYVFLQPVGFIIYVIAGVAETNRAPFDFPEAEQELVAGYNTEYSSVRFALFPQAEYINMATMSAVATDLYLGGWHGIPLLDAYGLSWITFLLKVGAILFAYIWMRWTLPRYRYDQLMAFGWKFLFPASVINLIVTAALALYFLNA